MHWALGKDEMMRRAERLNPSQISSFEHPLSVEGTDGEWHEDRKKIIPASADSSNVQNLEDYRSHHFNATMPPQSRNAVPASQVAPKFAVGRAPYAGVAKSTLAKGTSPSLVAAPVVNLTTEGKRQVLLTLYCYCALCLASLANYRYRHKRQVTYCDPGRRHPAIGKL